MREPHEVPIRPELAELLDQFLRSRDLPVLKLLADFLAARGSKHPTFDAANIVDELSFAVHQIRKQDEQAPSR